MFLCVILWLSTKKFQKQPFADVLQNRCSYKFCKIHRRTPVLEPFLNEVTALRSKSLLKKRLQHSGFPVNFVKFLRAPFLQNTSGRLLLNLFFVSLDKSDLASSRGSVKLFICSKLSGNNNKVYYFTKYKLHRRCLMSKFSENFILARWKTFSAFYPILHRTFFQ